MVWFDIIDCFTYILKFKDFSLDIKTYTKENEKEKDVIEKEIKDFKNTKNEK